MPASKDKLETTLHQVDLKTAELAALQPMKPADSDRLWKKFRLEWNYNSNHIEGNTLTYSETELLLIFDQTPAEPHTLRELEEMKAHDVAVALIRQWAADPERELSEADIRSLNETILVRPFWKEAVTPDGQSTRRLISVGEYKKQPNSVRLQNGEMFHYTEPEEVQREMGELIDWYRTEGGKYHPVVTAALLHYRFVRVHPFDDGNGRISRLLLNYHLLRNELPPIVIKSADKQNYLFALQRADVGDLDAFCTYVAEQLHWSLELSIKAGKGESVEEVGDWEKEVELLKRKVEARVQMTNYPKEELEKATIRWLEKNFPILVKEMEKRIGVFARFFKNAKFKVIIRKRGGTEIDISESEIDWSEILAGINSQIYSNRITLDYEFNDFLFGPIQIAIHKNPGIDIYINEENIAISNFQVANLNTEISIWNDIIESDLNLITDVGKKYFKKIEEAQLK